MDISKAILIVGLAFVVAYSFVNRHVYVPQAESINGVSFFRRVNVFTGSECFLIPGELRVSGKSGEKYLKKLKKDLTFCY